MENVTKRFLSLLVAVVMVLSMVPTTAFATTENTDETTTENTVVEETGVAEVNGTKYETLQAAINAANGGTVTVLTNITLDTDITVADGTVIDLNGKTLYINVENSYYNDVTIKNGSIVLGKDDVHVCDGYFLVNAGKTLVLNGVNVSSSAEGIKAYAVFHLKTGANLDLIDCTLDIAENEYSAGYVVYAGESTATVDITGTTLTAKSNGIVHATTVIEDSQLTIEAVEHGINRSGVIINDSAVTISGGYGRGITAQHGDLVITGNSVVDISDMGEATIELRNNKNLNVADTADVTVDVAVNNTTNGTITGEVKVPLTGNNGNAHIGAHTIWGQANVNASESMKLELYCGGTLVGTTVLVQKTPILNGSAKEVSWNFYLTEEAEAGDGYWDTTWEAGHPNVNAMPDKVVLYLDGEKVDEDGVLLSGPDSINKVYAAISTDGVITGFATTLQAAIDAADGKTVTLLRNVALADTLNVAAGTTVTLDLNGKTVSQTKAQTGGYSMIQNDGNLTILSSVEGGKLSYTDSGNGGEYVSNTITNRGTLTLKSGTVENLSSSTVASNGYPYAIDTSIWGAAAEVNTIIEGGKVYCENYSSMRLRADSETESVNITITGGEVYGRIEVQNPTSNKASKGTLTISDGKVYKNNSSMAIMFFANNSSGENMKASITGGMIDGAVGYSSYFGPVANFDENIISGGTFTTDVSQFCVEGFELSDEDGDGIYEIAKKLSGTGTEADPFLITDLDDLLLFRDMVNTYTSDGSNQFKGKFVKLTADVDLAGVNWTPIGTNSVGDHAAFLGTFDGDGHTIYNLCVNADGGHLGFFARVGSYAEDVTPTVKNLKFHNVDVSANVTDHWTANHGDYVGGVIANAGGNSVISNITVTGNVYIVGCGYVGGIVGHGYPDIDNCHVNANDGSYLKCGYWCGGGIIGYAGEGGTPITNCSVSGLDIWTAYGAGGGIAGLLQDGNKVENVTVSNLDITSDSDYCMGYIAGNGECSTMTDITVENVTATAKGNTITATDAVASVDGIVYFDLQAAVNAAEGKTVTLLRDVTLTDTLNVAAGTTVTLDLNGKTVSQTKACTASYEMVSNNGTLTIDDSVGGGKISFTDTGAGDPNAGWGVYTVRNAGTLVVNAGTIENLSAQNQAGQAFAHTVLAIFQYSGSTTINGGVISTPNYRSVRLWSGDMTIKGGEFSGQVWVQCVNDTSKLTIEGGEFAPCWNDASSVFVNNNYNNKAYVAEFGVTGGTFATKIGANDATTLNGSLICGGTFTESAMSNTNSALIAEGFVFEQNADGSYGVEEAPVAMVGTDKYKTIDEAIAAWTAGKTLTLLADVTLSDVITLKSTEHHILDLGTYTMTAASGKNAFVIKACGTGSAERSALTINADATNPGGINAGKKCVVYYKYADGGISTEDRPIIKINGGVFTGSTSSFGSAGIYTIGTAARKCATVNIAGGTFNCSIVGSSKSNLIVSGGTFNYTVSSQGDSTCSRLISGGKFKTIGFMTADSNNTKFWIGTSMGNSNVGVHVDDDGYIVVGGPVVTEPGTTFEASANYGGASSYLQYSSAKNNGLYYTSVEEAFADNNKASGEVTVYVDKLDMTGATYKGTILVPKGETLTITYAEGTTPTWKAAAAADDEAVAYTETVVDGVVTRVYRTITPVAQIGETYYETIAEAMAAATAGQTVTLLDDVALTEVLVLDKAITLDGNGKKLTSTAARAINVTGADGVTIKDLTIETTGERAINIIGNATNVAIEGVTATASNYTVNVAASAPNAVVAIKDSTLNGLCTVNASAAGVKVTVEDSTINCNDNNTTTGEAYAALSLNKEAVGGKIIATGCTVNVTEGSDSHKGRNGAEDGEVTINGSTDDVVVMVAVITYPGSSAYHAFATVQAALDFAKAGDTVTLIRDVTASEIIKIEKAITLDGNGKTLTYTGKDRAIDTPATAGTVDVTIKNLTVDSTASYCQRGINYNTSGKLTLEKVTVKGTNVTYAVNLPGSADNAEVTIKDSSLTGNIALNVWGENSTINVTDTDLIALDNSAAEGYAAVKLNNDGITAAEGTVINITGGKIDVTGSAKEDTEAVSNSTSTGEVIISDTTEVNGEIAVMVAVIRYADGNSYGFKTLADALKFAKAGETVTLLRDVTASEIIKIEKAITLDGNGKKLTSTAARAINVTGADGVTIKDLIIETTGERAINIIGNATNVAIEGVTATASNYTVNVAASAPSAVVAIKDSTLNGLCTVNASAAGVKVTVEDSTINCNDNNTTTGEAYAALSLNKEAVNGKIIATGCTVNVTEGSDSHKGRNGAEDGEVTINGSTDDVVVMVAVITYPGSSYYHGFTSLQKAIDFAEEGAIITLIRDVKETTIVKVDKNVTLDLNGNKVTSTAKKAFEVYADATICNGTIEGANRCVDTRKAVELTLTDVTLIADEYTSAFSNPQPLTIGGSENGTKVTMTNVNISAEDGYGIITFVETELTATNSTVDGYSALYVKPGSENSTFTFVKSALSGSTANNDVEGNSFSTIAVRADNVTVNTDADTTVSADGNYCCIISLGGSSGEGITGANVTVAGTINGNILYAKKLDGNTVTVKADYADELTAEGFVVENAATAGMINVAAKGEASYNGVNYASLSKALMDAYSAGGKVTLLSDCELTDMIASVPAGVTLDLNGNTLKVNNIWAIGQIVDSTAGNDGVLIANGNVILDENNAFMPLYDAAAGGYRFFKYQVVNLGAWRVPGVRYYYRVLFDNAEGYDLLASGTSKTQLVVDVDWDGKPVEKKVTYTYTADTITKFIAAFKQDPQNALFLNISGLDSLAANAQIRTTIRFVSETGVKGASEVKAIAATQNAGE